MEWLLPACALMVAFSNGANDNFKGFATVWGADLMSFRAALTLATLATAAGSIASLVLAQSLVQQFSGKGLVPDAVAAMPLFLASVAGAAAATVFLATRLGLPVSTTHALIGGLIGAGLGQSGGVVHVDKLLSAFLLPLLVSPVLAAMLGVLAYRVFGLHKAGVECACIVTTPALAGAGGQMMAQLPAPRLLLASNAQCELQQAPLRISVSRSGNYLHIGSAMSICFARAVNDTPKLAALLIAAHLLGAQASIGLIAIAMALGGLFFARGVALTMSRKMTAMTHTLGLTANLITAALVLFASQLGLPVSTTHVSLGAIAGVGASANTLNWSVLRNVLLSWVATLPLAAFIAWAGVTWLGGQ